MEEKAIIYPRKDGGICILWPAPQYPIEEIAKKDVPVGLPYKIINASELPQDQAFRDAWTADFNSPDGYGKGFSEWFIANAPQRPIPGNVADEDKPWPKV
jgi:hypothetical protein